MKSERNQIETLAADTQSLFYADMESDYGQMRVVSTDRALCGVFFINQEFSKQAALENIQARWPDADLLEDRQIPARLFADWYEKKTVPIALTGTDFQRAVWRALLSIPDGQTRTYSEIAEQINKPKAVRAVGTAVGKNPLSWLIPCHRVVRRDGSIGDYYWGSQMKRTMLKNEGVLV